MRAFVTGSTGLVGSNLVNLLLAQGYEVKALARSTEKARKLLTDPRIQIVQGDMEAVEGFAAEMRDCDVLFHAAARFREYYEMGDDWAKLEQINVHGTVNLLDAAERQGVKKVIYVSSVGVLDDSGDGYPVDESAPPNKLAQYNLYFKSKILAEQAIAEWLTHHQLPVVLVLPTGILGPQDAGPTAMGNGIVGLINGEVPIVPPGGYEFVDARDVAQAMINAVEKGKSGERYILSQGYHTMLELTQAIGEICGIATPKLVIPYPIMLAMAYLGEFYARLTGGKALLTVEGIRIMNSKLRVSTSKAQSDLGVNFRPLKETLRDEVNWYIANGYAKLPATVR